MKYLFNSRIATHIVFWIVYYFFFSLLWVKNGDYQASFFLEFVLLPVRIGAVYFTIYTLLPRYLLQKKFTLFGIGYLTVLIIGAILQRLSFYFFIEQNSALDIQQLFDLALIIRAIVLINTTVLLLLSVKILLLYFEEKDSERDTSKIIEIKADKRYYKVRSNQILYLEGLGNYVTYHLKGDKKVISYVSLKKANELLPDSFLRIHKSYVINTDNIISYNQESVEMISGFYLPISNSYKSVLALLQAAN